MQDVRAGSLNMANERFWLVQGTEQIDIFNYPCCPCICCLYFRKGHLSATGHMKAGPLFKGVQSGSQSRLTHEDDMGLSKDCMRTLYEDEKLRAPCFYRTKEHKCALRVRV